jgi:prepilin-type N-terminal cleavage/methylation domain-containing protein
MKKGFTLVELLVSISIMAIICGISIAAFVSVRNNKSVETVANEVGDTLNQAHLTAMSPPDTVSDLKYIEVYYDKASPTELKMQDVLEGGSTSNDKVIYTFNSNVNVTPDNFRNDSTIPTESKIDFIANDGITMGQIKDYSDLNPSPSLTISKSGNPESYTVTIDWMSGNVEVSR